MNHDSRSFEDDLSSLKADVAFIRSNYATKVDLQGVRIEVAEEIRGLRTELNGDLGELRVEIEKFRAEIQKTRAEFYEILNAQTWKMFWFGIIIVTAVHLATKAGY